MTDTHVDVPVAWRLYWSVRRELWENRSVYLGPLTVGVVVLIGFSIALVPLPGRVRAASAAGGTELRQVLEQPYVIVALMLMLVELLVAVFYCLDALYGERRDRSILFWKSLPVSDATAVLAKASIPILVLPLLTSVVTIATQGVMLLASSAVLAANGLGGGLPWTYVPFLAASRINLAHLVGFHGIWYAPFYAWLLLVSAWATRAPVLWAVLPPAAIVIVERIAFNSAHFARMIQNHLGVAGVSSSSTGGGGMSMEMLMPDSLGHFLTSPGLWIGLVVSASFLFGAVRLRRARGAM